MIERTRAASFLVASSVAAFFAVSCGSDSFTTAGINPDGGLNATGGHTGASGGVSGRSSGGRSGHGGNGGVAGLGGVGVGASGGTGGSDGGSSGNGGVSAGGASGGPNGGNAGQGGIGIGGASGAPTGGTAGMGGGGASSTGGSIGSGGTSSGGAFGTGGVGGSCASSGQSCGTIPCCNNLSCCTGGPIAPSPSGVGGAITLGVCRALCPISDRSMKQGLESVDPDDVLERVSSLPISSWSYGAEPRARHIGPMAQDFMAAFGVGSDERTILQVDADGVELASIQALRARLGRVEAENRDLRRSLDRLESRIVELESRACTAPENHRP